MRKIVSLFVLFFLNGQIFASDISQNEELNQIIAKDIYEPNYFGLMLGLVVVVGLVYLTAILYQKLVNTKIVCAKNDLLKPEIISSTSFGQNKGLYVVKIANEHILLGVSQNNISFLKNIEIKSTSSNGEINE